MDPRDFHAAAGGENADAGALSFRFRETGANRWRTENSPRGCCDVVVGPPVAAVLPGSRQGEHPANRGTLTEHSSLEDVKCEVCGRLMSNDDHMSREDAAFLHYANIFHDFTVRSSARRHCYRKMVRLRPEDFPLKRAYIGMGGGKVASSGQSPPQVSGATQPAEAPPIGYASDPVAQFLFPFAPPAPPPRCCDDIIVGPPVAAVLSGSNFREEHLANRGTPTEHSSLVDIKCEACGRRMSNDERMSHEDACQCRVSN